MSDKATRHAETVAAALMEEYLAECWQGRQPRRELFLERCPEAGKQPFEEAIEGVDLYLRYFHSAYVRPQIMEKTLQGLETIRRKKAWMAEAHERASRVWDLDITAPIDSLATVINIRSSANSTAGAATMARTQPLVLNRNGGHDVAPRLVDQTWRRARRQHLAQIVDNLLEQLDIKEVPIDLERITQRLYLFMQEADLGKTEGCLVTDGEVGGILLNRKTAVTRRRFTWAHEIGHFLLHKHMAAFQETQEILDDPSALHEIEANIFASLLLMPLSLLPPDFGKTRPTLAEADALSSRFTVSLEASLRVMLEQSHWRCALVISRYGRVERAVLSPLFNGYIPSGQRLHPDTAASDLKQVGDEETTVLSAQAWVQGELVDEEAEIDEQSRCLSEGYAYSLLTVRDPDY